MHTGGKDQERRVFFSPVIQNLIAQHTQTETRTSKENKKKSRFLVGFGFQSIMQLSLFLTLVKKEFIHLVKVFFCM
jgi:hypothetical protein